MAYQTATNPQTGERVILVGNQWLPISQTATNEKGQKAYLANNQWITESATPAPATSKPAGFSLGDIASSFGIGAVGSTKALTDVAGAGNVASAGLSQGIESLQAGMTPERQAELQRQAERMKAAEQSGSFLQEVKAAGQNVIEAPLQTAAQAVGSFVPYLPALLAAPAAAALRLGVGAVQAISKVAQVAPKVIGTAQGLGAVKGSIYEGVYKAEIDAGTSPEIAKQKADASQSYFGDNFGQIALGGTLGLVAGSSGIEKLLTPAGRAGVPQGLGRRVAGTTLAESLPEGVQGGQERLAQNLALQRGGFDVDTLTGVAGAATGEALAGALGAAPIAALSRPAPPPVATPPAAQAPVTPEPAPVTPVAPVAPIAPTPAPITPAPASVIPAPPEPVATEIAEPVTVTALPDVSAVKTQVEPSEESAPPPVKKDATVAFEEQQVEDSNAGKMVPGFFLKFPMNEQGVEGSATFGMQDNRLYPIYVDNGGVAGTGKFVQLYKDAVAEAERRGMQFTSDNSVTTDAANLYDALKRDGYTVTRNPTARLAESPEVVTPRLLSDDGKPVFTVTSPEAKPTEVKEEAPPFVEATPIVGEPAPQLQEVLDYQKNLEKAEKERRRYTQGKAKGLSLWTALRGNLTPEEVNDIGPGLMFKSLQKKGGVGGSDMSSLVADGKLDDFLPPRMRPMSEFHDEQEAVEYIKEKVRRQNYYTFDTNMAIQNLDNTVEELEGAIRELLTLQEINLEIQKATDEQAEIDRAAEATPAKSETRVTPERKGKDAGPAEKLTSPAPEKVVVKQEAPAPKDVPETKKEAPPILKAPPELKLKKGRNEQVVLAARELAAKRITREEYDRYVDYYTPIAPVLGSNLEAPIDNALMADILTTKIKQKKKAELINAPIAEDTRVGLRMDIPALEWGRANGMNGSVVSVHKGTSPNNKTTGDNISYRSTGHIKNVVFAPRDPNRSFSVAQNLEGRLSEKTPQQTIEGNWINTPSDVLFKRLKDLLNDPEWSQVSLDPTRHAYFYDRESRQPVVSADEVLQVGRFVLAKNVKYAERDEFLYSSDKSALGFNSTPEQNEISKALEGKTLMQVAKWAIDNAPNAVSKYFAQKVYDRMRQMEARGVKFNFNLLTGRSRPIGMHNARGEANFIWGKKDKGEDTIITVTLNGPTVVKNQSGYPPGVEYRTILHELLHVATRGQLKFLNSTDPLVKEVKDLFNEVVKQYNAETKAGTLTGLAKDYYNRINNAFDDPDEMISWGITDERMQKYMSGIKVGEGTVFSKLINLVRKVLGVAPPYESALDRLVRTTDEILSVDVEVIADGAELRGYNFGPGKKKATTGVQQSLFSKRVGELFGNKEATPSSGADDVMAQLGRKVKPPEPSYKEKIRQSWDNIKDNPKLTAEEAGKSVTTFLDKIQTLAFSGDAALNNNIRRAIYDSTMDSKDKIGTLLNTSISQTVHADALASLFITEGNLKYNDELHKWESYKEDANFIRLSKDIDVIAEKYGKTKAEAEVIAHTAFEAKRLKSMVEFNNQVDREVSEMKAEAASIRSSKPVASSALNEKANKRLTEKKFIHKINGESDLSVEDQIAAGMSLFSLMPELNAAVKTWNSIRENTSKILVDSGLWTDQEAEFLLDNADYVPFFREEQLEEGKGPKEYIRGLMVQAKEKKLKGSDKPVNDIFDNMIRWTQYSVNRAVRNKSAVALSDTAAEMGMAKKVESKADGKNVVRVWRNGVETFYDMEDPLFMDAFNGLESIAIPGWKWMSKMSDILRQTVVLYPLFSVSQLPQDSFAAMFTSGLKPRYALTIPARAAKEFLTTLFKQSQTHEQLKKFGVVGVKDFSAAVARLDAEIYAGFKARPGVLGRTKDLLSHIAMSADNAVRQAVYTASIDQGLSKAEALEKSFEIWNVRRRGSSRNLAIAGQVIPFFNAYLAAQNVAYKTITGVGTSPTERENAFKTLIATTGSVMMLSLLYAMLNGDDEDYENKPAVVRDRLLMIPGTGGLSIPLRADLFTLPKIITEHTYLLMTDKGYEDGRKFRDSVKAALGSALLSPTVVPQAIKPLLEVGINYNFFSGRPLIGEFEKKKETAQQFNNSTSEIAKLLGSTGLVSPIAVDHLMRGMFGSAGGLVIYMTNPVLHSDLSVDRPSLSLRDAMATLPGTSGFISREYESGLKNDFYVLRDEVSKVAATVADLKVTGPDKIEEYLSSEEKMARYGLSKGVNKITDQLGKIRKAITFITNQPSSEMSSAEKQEAIKELRETEREILRAINVKELRKMAQI